MIKRNLKLYLKQKSSIIALSFFFLSIFAFILTFFPGIKNKDGVIDTFKHYDIEYVTTNNYNVVYATSRDNSLFYSQSKQVKSTLNSFVGIKTYENAYGSMNAKEYNFIRIPYTFPSKIIDVQGIGDDMGGDNGETLVLLDNGNVYLISNRSSKVQLILNDVLTLQIIQDGQNNNKISYIYLDKNYSLYYSYIDANKLIRKKIAENFKYESYSFLKHYVDGNIDSFTFFIKIQNEIKFFDSLIMCDKEKISLVNSLNDYPLYQSEIVNIETKENNLFEFGINQPIKANKFLRIEDVDCVSFYFLNEGKVSRILYNYTSDSFMQSSIDCENYIDDIYTCGINACIAVTKNGLYYFGELQYLDISDQEFTSLNIKNGRIYGTRHSLIYLANNNRFYFYNKSNKTYEAMYQSLFVCYILRWGAVFVFVMIIFYLIFSFADANKRYNRYFSVNNED